MSLALNAATALFTLGALVISALSAGAWWRSGQPRLGVLALGFLLFGAAGAWTAVGLFTGKDALDMLTAQTLLSAAGVFVTYIAAVKR